MPAPAHIVQEDIVGPSLGQESINAGIFSFVVALILLMIYMCSMYGFIPGMVANCALFLNFFFTLGILSSFQAALTMSGIAGMVLSLGMAVDANVLIYERTKEELRAGKGVKKALADGYSNAFSAIFDSNLTSIITGIILFNFGTGPIRGFATTLIIGILVSFFTAVFMTRLVYEHFMNKDKWLNLTFTSKISRNLLVNTRFDFMGTNKKSLIIVSAIILVCIGSFGLRGLSQSIDFTGGRNFKVQFENPVEPEQVRELIADKFGEDVNVNVIAIGTDKKTVRISTNYRIADEGNNVDSEIESYLYETLKPLLTQNITLATFIDRDNHTGGSIVSSQKVGPSIADDIIDVDYTVRCCPIDTMDFIDVLQRALYGSNKFDRTGTMCGQCKRNGTDCFFDQGQLCLGLVTVAGCGAKCVNLGRACNGCRGLSPDANLEAARAACERAGVDPDDFDEALALFNQVERVQSARE